MLYFHLVELPSEFYLLILIQFFPVRFYSEIRWIVLLDIVDVDSARLMEVAMDDSDRYGTNFMGGLRLEM